MPSIFVRFRMVDNRWMRDRVHQALTDTFGVDEVFKSGESIPPGPTTPRPCAGKPPNAHSRWWVQMNLRESGARLIGMG